MLYRINILNENKTYFYGNFSSLFFFIILYIKHTHNNDCDFLQQSTCMKEKKTKQSNNDWSLKVTEINGYQCKYKVFPVFSLNSRDHMKCEHRPHWFYTSHLLSILAEDKGRHLWFDCRFLQIRLMNGWSWLISGVKSSPPSTSY